MNLQIYFCTTGAVIIGILFCRLGAMMTAEYILELNNVFHSGQVRFISIDNYWFD